MLIEIGCVINQGSRAAKKKRCCVLPTVVGFVSRGPDDINIIIPGTLLELPQKMTIKHLVQAEARIE